MTNLGALYHDGRGVAQDYAKAREWYEKAAAKDDADAMFNLGLLYDNGQGVAQDYAKARAWYQKAAAKGHARAKARLEQLSAPATPPPVTSAPATPPPAAQPSVTQISDTAAVRRLKANRGIALQWISWDRLGRLTVTESNGLIHVEGAQTGGSSRLEISGDVLSIDQDRFTFKGRINIYNAPSDRKQCLRDGVFEFRITGKRQYWRLQQMEGCDGLTDYVDTFF